jgi:hypothetical protein
MDYNQNADMLPAVDNAKLPSTLNTLTILSLIGCGLAFLSGIYSFFTSCNNLKDLDKLEDVASGSGMMADMIQKSIELGHKTCDNKLVLLIAILVCTSLCLFGVLQMRKYKKIGLPIYIAGELLYPILFTIIMGASALSGFILVSSLLFPIIMVILYIVNRKYLTQ